MKKPLCLILAIVLMLVPAGCSKPGVSEALSTGSEAGSSKDISLIFADIKASYIPLYGIMINCGAWNDAQEIPVYMYYAWYREYINSITEKDERIEKYSYDGIPGWSYPKDEFESFVGKYFNVDAKYLQSGDIYNEELQIYSCEGGRAMADYTMELQSPEDITLDNDLTYVKIYCKNSYESKRFCLVLDISAEPYRFISCLDEPI